MPFCCKTSAGKEEPGFEDEPLLSFDRSSQLCLIPNGGDDMAVEDSVTAKIPFFSNVVEIRSYLSRAWETLRPRPVTPQVWIRELIVRDCAVHSSARVAIPVP